MIIDKKFSVITYAGSEPLNLITKDTDILNDTTKNNEWDRMMQAVDTIYGTQRPDNTIPVFWTRRFNVVDNFGNSSYRYAPHPDSTLTQLESKSAYYVILRDSSLVPFKIPFNGSLVLGYNDATDLPLVSPSLPDITLDKDSFEYVFKPRVVNLKPYQNYSYSWKVLSANWPVVANALSGVLKPASTTGTINASMTFCPTTGECSDNVLEYVIPEECSLEQTKNPYITLQLSIKSDNNNESLGDPFTINCDDCLPRARINLSGIDDSLIIEPISDTNLTPSYSFQISFNNLESDIEYSYILETLIAEWPIVYVSPISGSFINKTKNTPSINGKFYFCPSTGLCPPNSSTIPNYTIPPYPKFLTHEAEYNIAIRASLSADPTCSPSTTIYSDIHSVRYKKS